MVNSGLVVFFNGSHNNESQYGIAQSPVHVTNLAYEQRGLYQVFSMAWNAIGVEFTELSLAVVRIFEIKTLTITTDSYALKTKVPNLKFYIRALKGSVSLCNVTYGDGEYSEHETTFTDFYDTIENSTDIDTAIKTDPGIEHDVSKPSVYSHPGFYSVRVVCENEINSVNYSTTILAQDQITGFHVFPISAHEFGRTINVVWQMYLGTNVTVDIWYNDLLCNTTNITITNNQNNSRDCLVTNSMHFDPDYLVDIKLTARNLVSNITEIVTVQIFRPMVITGFVALTTTAQWGSGEAGAGPNRNKFPAEYPVLFRAIYTGGPPTLHDWTFQFHSWIGYCTNCGTRTDNSVEREYLFGRDDNLCDVKLKLTNPAGTAEEWVAVDIDKSFNLTSVTIDSPVVVNRTEKLTIKLADIGKTTCIAVDFGDNSPLLLYGNYDACHELYNHTSRSDVVFSPRNLSTTSIGVDHVFETVGTYQVKVDGRNYVSWDSFQQEVVVAEKECEYPNVTITGNVYTVFESSAPVKEGPTRIKLRIDKDATI